MSWNPLDMTGKRVVVTGASSGIGRSIAIALSRLGAGIALLGRNEARLEETRSLLQGEGHEIHPCDLSDIDQIPPLFKNMTAGDRFISAVAHSAGVHNMLPIQIVKRQHIAPLFEINVYAALSLARGLSQKGVVHPSGGSLVYISSVAGLTGQAGLSIYSASKAAIIGMTRSLAVELAPSRIRVNAVAPGYVQDTAMSDSLREKLTDAQFQDIERMHPLGLGQAEDVAQSAAFLLSDASRWITGTVLSVDGGYACL